MGMESWFTFGRPESGYPTRYEDQKSAAHIDVLTSGLITAFVIVAIGFLAILPSYNFLMRKVFLCRVICSLFIGGVIVVGNYGHQWEKGEISMSAPYKPGIPDEVAGSLGLHIALRGINITLKGGPAHHGNENDTKNSPLHKEQIDYNEHFSWEWNQGRFGFDKYAGRISRDFREAVIRGLPLPILQVAEYFTFDGEGIRFGRHYRLAGWYSHLILWFAFGTWLISNILFCMVIRTAALFLFITGALQLASVAVWALIRNSIEITIPFQSYDGKGDIILKTSYGIDFYLVLGTGLFCLVLSGLISILDALYPDEMCYYFGIDPLTIYDELLLSKKEIKDEQKRLTMLQQGQPRHDIEMHPTGVSTNPLGDAPDDEKLEKGIFLRRRQNVSSQLIRASFRVKPRIPRRSKGVPLPSELNVRQPLLGGGSTSDEEGVSGGESGEIDPAYGSWPPPPTPITLKGPLPPPPVPPKRR